MQVFMQPLEKLSEYGELKARIPQHKGILQLSGCVESQKAHMIYGLLEGLRKDGRPCAKNCLIVAENDLKAKELYEDYRLYDRDVYLYPAKDLIFFQEIGRASCRERV